MLAIEHWVPLGGREFAVLVLVVFAFTTIGMFARW
jgi:hypothetical protein